MRTVAALTHSYTAIVATLLVLLACTPLIDGIKCRIGMGQRGKMYENGIEWFRDCPNTKYCIEVYSGDQAQWEKLFDYPFDAYYNEYYARTCGGDLGTPEDYHPYRNNPEAPLVSSLDKGVRRSCLSSTSAGTTCATRIARLRV